MLEKVLKNFLNLYFDESRPVLLALSGGPDSICLFHLLKALNVQFEVAHVDHGWRTESAEESKHLEELSRKANIPFHSKRLDPNLLNGNLEQACRLERLSFFSQICQERNCQSVILGHHADDQSESVIKKIIEGSNLAYLNGMNDVSKYEGLILWRPFITEKKTNILKWLKDKRINYFLDKTNEDPRFLRARLRTTLFPLLEKTFGKEIKNSLCRLGNESNELKKYLEVQLKPYIENIQTGLLGSYLDFSKNCPEFDLELKFLIRKVFEKQGVSLSYHLINQACDWIRSKKADCCLGDSQSKIYMDRGFLFVQSQSFSASDETIPLKEGESRWGNWSIQVKEATVPNHLSVTWKDVWKGDFSFQIREGTYHFAKGDKRLFKTWTHAKVPAFLRWITPVLWDKEEIVLEFLSNKMDNANSKNLKSWDVSFRFIKN